LRISAAATTDRATAVQVSHCRTSSLTVFSTVWKMLCKYRAADQERSDLRLQSYSVT
jgi:hypothetical protein